jgi:hypothetical protein
MHSIDTFFRWLAIAVATALFTPAPAVAQDESTKFELTPFAAYRGGGQFEQKEGSAEFDVQESSAWGLILNGKVEANTEWEVLYSSQSTSIETTGAIADEPGFDMDIEYLHVGGTYLFDGDRVRPFIAATLGASRFGPRPSGFSAETFVSESFGGGWKISLAKNLALRIEARGFATLVDDDSRLFCASSEAGAACLLVLDGSFFTQWETRAGLTFRF